MRTEHLQYLLSFHDGVTIEALAEELHITLQSYHLFRKRAWLLAA